MPEKRDDFGNIDLRSSKTQDGKEMLYDRLQRYYSETEAVIFLDRFVVSNSDLSYGTKSQDGTKAEAAAKIIDGYRELAANPLLAEEAQLHLERERRERLKGDVLIGKKDVTFQPYR